MTKKDTIVLTLPFKAEYVSVARLTASGVASRMGFDIEVLEDIKVSIAEVSNKLVSIGSKSAEEYSIKFEIAEDKLKIVFDCIDKGLKCAFSDDDDVLSIALLTALMDEVELCTNNSYLFSMTKVL